MTLRQVAQEVGLSVSTVSRVLSGGGPVSSDTREAVMRAVDALGYRPNTLAQGLRTGRTNAVALAVSDIEQGWHASLTKHLQVALEEIGIDLLLFNLGHDIARLEVLISRVQSMRLRGVILASSQRLPPKQVALLVSELGDDAAVLSIGQRLDRHGIPSFVHNDTEAAGSAVDYLLQKDRWPIAYCSRISTSTMGQERFRGYKKAIERAGFKLDPQLVWDLSTLPVFRQASGYQAMTEAIQRKIPVRSVLTGSDEIALGAMAAVLDHGLRVPEDLAIVGFGGLDWTASVRPRLTTLSSDLTSISQSVKEFYAGQRSGSSRHPLLTKFKREILVRASA